MAAPRSPRTPRRAVATRTTERSATRSWPNARTVREDGLTCRLLARSWPTPSATAARTTPSPTGTLARRRRQMVVQLTGRRRSENVRTGRSTPAPRRHGDAVDTTPPLLDPLQRHCALSARSPSWPAALEVQAPPSPAVSTPSATSSPAPAHPATRRPEPEIRTDRTTSKTSSSPQNPR